MDLRCSSSPIWRGPSSPLMRSPCTRSSDHGRRRAIWKTMPRGLRPLHQAKRCPRWTRGEERGGGKNWQTSKVGLWPAIGPGESSRRRSERVLERKGLSSLVHVERVLRCVPHVCTLDEHRGPHRILARPVFHLNRHGTDSRSIQGRIYTEIDRIQATQYKRIGCINLFYLCLF